MGYEQSNADISLIKKASSRFFRLNIAKKLLLGYLPLPILIIVISVFALTSLNRINKINNSILKTDVPLIDIADKMIDTLFAQELYGRRYAILKGPELLGFFWKKSEEFNHLAEQISILLGGKEIPIAKLTALHAEYNHLFMEGVEYLGDPASSRSKGYDGKIKKKQEELVELIKKISSDAKHDQGSKALMTSDIGAKAFRVTVFLCILSLFLSVSSTAVIAGNISGSINQLKVATKQISEGRFDYIDKTQTQDELGELSWAFSEMSKRLKQLEEMNLDANPLTRLPGGLAIENIIQKRLDAGTPLAFCLIDLDNFKAFSDRYGYAKGSEVIKAAASLIDKAVAVCGAKEDFVGHIGGDDFVVICSPDRFEAICNSIIESFDKMIPDFYDTEDRDRGYIQGKTRQGEEIEFPIMTISIAVASSRDHKFINTIEVGEVAAELKEYAKSVRGSNFVTDRREEVFHELHYKEKNAK